LYTVNPAAVHFTFILLETIMNTRVVAIGIALAALAFTPIAGAAEVFRLA
jgi:hypothetical protein